MNMGGKEVMDIKPGNIPCVGSEHGGTRLLQHTDDDNEGFICSIKCDNHPTSVITACQIRFVYYMVQFMIWQNESGMILFRDHSFLQRSLPQGQHPCWSLENCWKCSSHIALWDKLR